VTWTGLKCKVNVNNAKLSKLDRFKMQS